jgi:hypothetical protein
VRIWAKTNRFFSEKDDAMKRREILALGLVVILTNITFAADKPNPTGTWKWTVMRNNQNFDQTLKLKLEDSKLTGTLIGRNNRETKIEDASFKDGEVAFSVTRERNGQKITTKYKGKLDGDTIKGKAETERDGQNRSRDWEAKREKT